MTAASWLTSSSTDRRNLLRRALSAGKVVLSTNDASCRPTAAKPCPYTLVDLRFRVEDFDSHGATVKSLEVALAEPVVGLLDFGGGLALRGKARFFATGFVNDAANQIGVEVKPTGQDSLDVHVNLDTQSVTILGELSGKAPPKDGQSEEDRDAITLDVSATSRTPLANLPPIANAGADQSLSTSCYANVTLTPASTDPNGNLSSETWVEGGLSLGSGTQTVRMLPGKHRVELMARDSYGGQDADTTVVTVTDNGETAALPGGTVVSFQVPKAVPVESVVLLAKDTLRLADRVKVRPAAGGTTNVVNWGPAGAPVRTSLHADTVTTADVWSRPKVWLLERAKIVGHLFTSVEPDKQNVPAPSTGTTIGANFADFTTISFAVPPATAAVAVGNIEPNQVRDLAIGEYGSAFVKSRAKMVLHAGVYRFSRLETEPQAAIELADPGSTVIYLDGGAAFKGAVTRPAGGNLVVINLSTSELLLNSPFRGTVFSPNSQLTLNNSGGGAHIGAFFAKKIQVDSASTVMHSPADLSFIIDARAACALEPKVICVRSTPSGPVARFGFDNDVDFATIKVPRGVSNRLLPGSVAQNQPEFFSAGYLGSASKRFDVPFASGTSVTWVLGGRQVTASSTSAVCP